MFTLRKRASIKKQKVLSFTKDEASNPSTVWKRYKQQVKKSIDDMTLLYQKLPNEKKNELYNLKNFDKLFEVLFDDEDIDYVKIELANFCVNKALGIIKKEILLQNKYTKSMASPLVEVLEKTQNISQDLKYKEEILFIRSLYFKEADRYLFSWNKVGNREKLRLVNYIHRVLDIPPFDFKIISSKGNSIKGTFKDEKELAYKFRITINYVRLEADMLIDCIDNKSTVKRQFKVIKFKSDGKKQVEENDYDVSDYILYFEKADLVKLNEIKEDLD